MYADALQNPPLLVVSDLQTIVIHTNFTNTVKREHRFKVTDLDTFETRQLLEAVFKNPERLRPGVTRAAVTQEAADKFTKLATALRARKHPAGAVAHFLNRLLFCMFAEDINLLPGHLFTKLVESSQGKPDLFEKRSRDLFAAMHKGGDVAFENIEWFNGGLFENDATLRLEADDLKLLLEACKLDWSEIEPSVFGTLFERGLDPDKRSQLGAHYTDPETIMKIVRPVVVEPWLAEWAKVKSEIELLLADAASRDKIIGDEHASLAAGLGGKTSTEELLTQKKAIIGKRKNWAAAKGAATKLRDQALLLLTQFLQRLRGFTVLDPACGSGNFLYLSLRALKDTEKRILIEAEMLGLGRQFPDIGPKAVKGIELNGYAAELARVTIWIGEIQWMIANGYGAKKNPILQPLDQIEHRDALLNPDGSEAVWPQADVVVGNPPFLGGNKKRRELGDATFEALGKAYKGRVGGAADLVCYWFDKARIELEAGRLSKAGFVSTQSIRNGINRAVLDAIASKSAITHAWSDEPWVNEGAAVRVSLIAFGKVAGSAPIMLDGNVVSAIHADLTSGEGIDITRAAQLTDNQGMAFQGSKKVGPFEVEGTVARTWLKAPNPHAKPNSEVLKPSWIGLDLTRRPRDIWIVDFSGLGEAAAANYEAPFAHVNEHVRPLRIKNTDKQRREHWWLLGRSSGELRKALSPLTRSIATPEVSKHRIFAYLNRAILPDCKLIVVAREDDVTFGLLQGHAHTVWATAAGSMHGVGNDPRYTPSTCFETFPFPDGLTPNIAATDYASDPRAIRIGDAARKLVEARDRWLNPAEWTEQIPEVVPGYPARISAKPGHEADLKTRTLTNLYNARPAWLVNLHHALDEAVAAAYGWEWPLSDDEVLRRLFALNQQRSAP